MMAHTRTHTVRILMVEMLQVFQMMKTFHKDKKICHSRVCRKQLRSHLKEELMNSEFVATYCRIIFFLSVAPCVELLSNGEEETPVLKYAQQRVPQQDLRPHNKDVRADIFFTCIYLVMMLTQQRPDVNQSAPDTRNP